MVPSREEKSVRRRNHPGRALLNRYYVSRIIVMDQNRKSLIHILKKQNKIASNYMVTQLILTIKILVSISMILL